MAIDLQIFCMQENHSRFAMNKPFVRNGWRYATNGHICVRVPAPGEPDTEEEKKFPPPEELFYPLAPQKGSLLTLHQTPVLTDQVEWCDACMGINMQKLKEDQGKGDCEACGGSGRVLVYSREIVGNHTIAAIYGRMMRQLPNTCYHLGPKNKPLRFFFEGGEGAFAGVNV